MRREQYDNYRLRTKDGKISHINPKLETIDIARLIKEKMEDKYNIEYVICHEEVYKYFDDNGNFFKEERLLSIIE